MFPRPPLRKDKIWETDTLIGKEDCGVGLRIRLLKEIKESVRFADSNEPDIMDVAHIKPAGGDYKRKYTPQDIKNLITLCPNDHRRFDKKLIQLNNSAHLKLS